MSYLRTLSIAIALTACGGGGGTDTDAGHGLDSGSPGDSGMSQSDSGTSPDAGPIDTDGGPIAVDSGLVQPLDAGLSNALHVEITDVAAFSNCMPGIGRPSGDPHLTITLSIEAPAETTYTVTSVTIEARSGSTPSPAQLVMVDPSSGTFPAGSSTLELDKVSGEPLIAGCSLCDADLDVTVVLDTPGGPMTLMTTSTLGCAF